MSDPKQDTELQDQLSPTKEKLEVLAAGSDESDSESESEENGVIGASGSSDNSATESKNSAGLTNGSITDDTDDEDEEKEETIPVTNGALETEADPKKDYQSSDTEDNSEVRHEPASSDPNDGVSIKSKMAPTAYEDDDNFDDLLADLPEDNGVASPAAIEASPELVEEEEEVPSDDHSKSPSPMRSPSPDQEIERTRSPTPERKDSRGSNGSSSFDERASSLSPEPPKVIAAPAPKITSPLSTVAPSEPRASPIARIYTDKIVNNVDSDSEEAGGKVVRQKPAGDITQIYTQKLVNSQESPKPERAKFVRPSRDITQLYTAALHKEDKSPSRVEGLPKRTGDITKLYTGGLGGADGGKAFKGKPNDERTNPTKHNMSTAIDREAIKEAYIEVMSDGNGIEWATFIFKDNKLEVTAKGSQFNEFKSQFNSDDRGFGYIKIMTGDEMSKRSKFVMVTWVGSNVSVMKKAKMSTDKALMKDIIQNLSVEMQCENVNEITEDRFKTEVIRAGGANYGTGVRDK